MVWQERRRGLQSRSCRKHLIVLRKLWHSFCKVFVEEVEGHFIMTSPAVSQEVLEAHVVVAGQSPLLPKCGFQVF